MRCLSIDELVASGQESALPVQETRETLVRSLDGEDLLEEEVVLHPSLLAWTVPWMVEPRGLQSVGKASGTT